VLCREIKKKGKEGGDERTQVMWNGTPRKEKKKRNLLQIVDAREEKESIDRRMGEKRAKLKKLAATPFCWRPKRKEPRIRKGKVAEKEGGVHKHPKRPGGGGGGGGGGGVEKGGELFLNRRKERKNLSPISQRGKRDVRKEEILHL